MRLLLLLLILLCLKLLLLLMLLSMYTEAPLLAVDARTDLITSLSAVKYRTCVVARTIDVIAACPSC
jgi:hypothetical protein